LGKFDIHRLHRRVLLSAGCEQGCIPGDRLYGHTVGGDGVTIFDLFNPIGIPGEFASNATRCRQGFQGKQPVVLDQDIKQKGAFT
jgi:hypothetical protein